MIPLDHGVKPQDADVTALARRIITAKNKGKKILVMIGGHVVKEGCSRIIIDLMKKGWIDHIAGNGAVSIHDFEVAMIGETSEDVPNGLVDGSFGMADETGRMMNYAIREAAKVGEGYGAAIAKLIGSENLSFKEESIVYNALLLELPVTFHVAIGGDIIHQHPCCDGAALGATSYLDFKLLTESVSLLQDGVVLNIGSAVLMPEVFLKALTIVRNLGMKVGGFTTANFDFIDMYRPRTRIVEWPKIVGATGFDIRGPHSETIPALHWALTDSPQS